MAKKKKRNDDAAPIAIGTASSVPEGKVTVKFTCPAFRHQGVEYKSALLEQRAAAGDEQALLVIAELVEMQSGIIEIIKGEGGQNE